MHEYIKNFPPKKPPLEGLELENEVNLYCDLIFEFL
jgi:hypothetical protein